MAKTKPTTTPTGPAPERVPLRHGFVALMYDELQPGEEPPARPDVKKPVYRPGVS